MGGYRALDVVLIFLLVNGIVVAVVLTFHFLSSVTGTISQSNQVSWKIDKSPFHFIIKTTTLFMVQ